MRGRGVPTSVDSHQISSIVWRRYNWSADYAIIKDNNILCRLVLIYIFIIAVHAAKKKILQGFRDWAPTWKRKKTTYLYLIWLYDVYCNGNEYLYSLISPRLSRIFFSGKEWRLLTLGWWYTILSSPFPMYNSSFLHLCVFVIFLDLCRL